MHLESPKTQQAFLLLIGTAALNGLKLKLAPKIWRGGALKYFQLLGACYFFRLLYLQ